MNRAVVFALALALAGGPALAEEPPSLPLSPDIVEETARTFFKGLRRLVDQIPMFEPPRVTSEGDIILKRIRPPASDGEEAKAPRDTGGGIEL